MIKKTLTEDESFKKVTQDMIDLMQGWEESGVLFGTSVFAATGFLIHVIINTAKTPVDAWSIFGQIITQGSDMAASFEKYNKDAQDEFDNEEGL